MKQVVYLGPEGSYSHIAAEKFGLDAELKPIKTIRQALEFADQTPGALAVLPIENSVEGTVRETIDNLVLAKNLRILSQIILPINHCLLGNDAAATTVVSHPQALSQCQNFIHSQNFNTVEATSTAAAAQNLQPGQACIANKKTAEIYGLDILHENINDNPDNQTRFALIGDFEMPQAHESSTLLAFSTANEPGALLKVLQIFQNYGINLSYIASRPSKIKFGEYKFFVEFDGHSRDEKIAKMLEETKQHTRDLKILGSYSICI